MRAGAAWPALLDLLAPPACQLCGGAVDAAPDRQLCAGCRAGLRREIAPRRLAHWPGGAAWALAPHGGLMRRAVKRLKYGGRYALGPLLGGWLGAELLRLGVCRPGAVTMVPLHWRRRWARGYNQAARVAAGVAACWQLPLTETLIKNRPLPSQVGRSRSQRRSLPGGVFRAAAVTGQRLLLVDDVWTTGTTTRACRAALEAAGAAPVWVATVTYAGGGGDD